MPNGTQLHTEAGSGSPLFWYSDIIGRIAKGPRRVRIFGAKRMGKTHVLRQIEQMRKAAVDNQDEAAKDSLVLFLDGRDTLAARKKLLEGIQAGFRGCSTILIDNVDDWLKPVTGDTFESLNGDVRPVAEAILGGQFPDLKVVVTLSYYPDRTSEPPTDWPLNPKERILWWVVCSNMISPLEPEDLKPWSRVANGFEDDFIRWMMKRLTGGSSPEGSELEASPLCKAWLEQIRRLSGFHPGIAGPAVECLTNLLDRRGGTLTAIERQIITDPKPNSPDVDQPESGSQALQCLEAGIRRYLEDVLTETALPPLAAAVKRLRTSTDPVLRAAFRELLFLVLDPEAEQPRNPMVRNIMIREGFAYRDDNTNKLVVPGTLLQQQVLRMAALPLTIEKDESATDAGRAIIRAADGSIHQFSLDGILFRVLNLLWCHPGRTFSSPEIQERAPLKDDRAVLNAMHRLREKLDQYGAGDWLQSERQRGYQFDMPLD